MSENSIGNNCLALQSLVREMAKELQRFINCQTTLAKDVGLCNKGIEILNRHWVREIINIG